MSFPIMFIDAGCKSFDFPKEKSLNHFSMSFGILSFICVLMNQHGLLLAEYLLKLQKQPFCCLFSEAVIRLVTWKWPSHSCGIDNYVSNRNEIFSSPWWMLMASELYVILHSIKTASLEWYIFVFISESRVMRKDIWFFLGWSRTIQESLGWCKLWPIPT